MKLTIEDIYKFGTKDEIEFLLEAGFSAQGEFASVFSQFKERAVKDASLKETYKDDLLKIQAAVNAKKFSTWVATPEAKEILKKFKQAIVGKVNQGAFAGAVTEVDDPLLVKN